MNLNDGSRSEFPLRVTPVASRSKQMSKVKVMTKIFVYTGVAGFV